MTGVYWGMGRACKYSGTRRGIAGIREHLGVPRGYWRSLEGNRAVGGVRDVLGVGRECRCSGARRAIGGKKGAFGVLRGVGCIKGIRGVEV